jgi:hypothetical protein
MKIFLSICLLLGILSVPSFAAKKDKESEDFLLQVHIVKVDMVQGQRGVSGSGSTDSDGNYSSTVSGGGSYLYHVFNVHIDGDNRELKMTSPAAHYKGGKGLAVATMGWSAVATARRNEALHIGDYKGHWNKDGSLEIQFLDEKGKLKHQPFFIQAESPLPSEQPVGDKQSR